MSFYYPENEDALYYVEFERGGHKGEFTIFKRQWFHSQEQLEKLKIENPDGFAMAMMTNEGHPWNIFTATYGPLGSMPDERWVRFMVDALNREVKQEQAKVNYDAAIASAAKLLAEDIDKEILDQLIKEAKKST